MCARLKVTEGFLDRFLGLMGKKELTGDGLFLIHVSSIHTCFMRFSIGVVYLDRNFRVIAREQVAPWRVGAFIKGASHVIEVEKGGELRFPVGEILELMEEGDALC